MAADVIKLEAINFGLELKPDVADWPPMLFPGSPVSGPDKSPFLPRCDGLGRGEEPMSL